MSTEVAPPGAVAVEGDSAPRLLVIENVVGLLPNGAGFPAVSKKLTCTVNWLDGFDTGPACTTT